MILSSIFNHLHPKVIFLDFDGPLSNWRTLLADGGTLFVDSVALKALNMICEASGAKVVCSSSRTWLNHPSRQETFKLLGDAGFDIRHLHPEWCCNSGEWHDDKVRYIKDYLKRHPEITHYAVVDDDPLKGIGPYVRVSEHDGIRKRDLMKIARCLDFDIGDAFNVVRARHHARQLRLPLDNFDTQFNQSILRSNKP